MFCIQVYRDEAGRRRIRGKLFPGFEWLTALPDDFVILHGLYIGLWKVRWFRVRVIVRSESALQRAGFDVARKVLL